MLLLVLVMEYLAGEAAFEFLSGEYGHVDLNAIYYIVVSLIDAFVCSYVISTNSNRHFIYGIISISLVFVHIFIGLITYAFNLNPILYESIILVAFVLKLMVAVIPDGDNSHDSVWIFWRSLVYRCYVACATRVYWNCL